MTDDRALTMLMAELGQRMGLGELALDADGACALRFDGRSVINLQHRPNEDALWLYADLGRKDYVLVATLALIFSIMTSYARARAESLISKCKVGFMERPERIVLFMIGAFTDRMAAVLWVILVLSIVTVANRIYYTYLELDRRPMPATAGVGGTFWRFFFWRSVSGLRRPANGFAPSRNSSRTGVPTRRKRLRKKFSR